MSFTLAVDPLVALVQAGSTLHRIVHRQRLNPAVVRVVAVVEGMAAGEEGEATSQHMVSPKGVETIGPFFYFIEKKLKIVYRVCCARASD
jgi:hypothetical protein